MMRKSIFCLFLLIGFLNADTIRDNTKEIVIDTSANLMWEDHSYIGIATFTWSDAINHCENSTSAGYLDWHLPNFNELYYIVDKKRYDPAANSAFQNIGSFNYWTSTTTADSPPDNKAWAVNFKYGISGYYNKDYNLYVICIRDRYKYVLKTGQTKSYDTNGDEVTDGSIKDDGYYQKGTRRNYTRDNINEIVIDNATGLQWQDSESVKTVRRTWAESVSYCENLSFGGYDDWRLPTRKELKSIVDYGRCNPSIDDTFFQNIEDDGYWSSTDSAALSGSVWTINFADGYQDYFAKTVSGGFYARCVRTGE